MPFKENLLEKIEIDRLTGAVLASLGPPGSGRKLDREAAAGLIAAGDFEYCRVRDLDLYLFRAPPMEGRVLVLDNELPIYRTTVADVALRKSPTIREMISIRNAVKILSDGDVVVSKRRDSAFALRAYAVGALDLSYTGQDLESLARDGKAAFERGDADGAVESLQLFAEILGWQPPPKEFRIQHHEMLGDLSLSDDGSRRYGPLVVYGTATQRLLYVDRPLRSTDKGASQRLQQMVIGDGAAEAAAEGPVVFDLLRLAAAGRGGGAVAEDPPAWLAAV